MSLQLPLLARAIALLFLLQASASAAVQLIAPSTYVPGVPYPIRVEVHKLDGSRDLELWDAEATLSVAAPAALSTNKVQIRNGIGSVLLTISGTQDIQLSAVVQGQTASKTVRSLAGVASQTVSGVLPVASHNWSGVVRVTGDVTVPAGATLRIAPGTWVLVNGIASGTSGVRLIINGSLNSAGTQAEPVAITCVDPTLNWGQISHQNSAPSEYNWTFISRAGRAPGEGHTGTGPAIRPRDAALVFRNSVISDLTAGAQTVGKIMQSSGSTLTFDNTVFSRARMGPEIASTSLLLTNCFVSDMTGPDDSDGIYLHSAGGRTLELRNSVFAGGTDDAIDTLDANVTVDGCIVRDWPNPAEDAKGISVFHGNVSISRSLFVNCYVGVSGKSSGPQCSISIDHATIVGITQGVAATYKDNAAAGNISISITNSIVRAPDALYSYFGPERFTSVSYSLLSEPWPGAGNLQGEPLFVNAAAGNYRLQSASPAIDAGDPSYPLDANGSRTDAGYYTGQSRGSGMFVGMTSPQNGASIQAPSTVPLAATAIPAGGATVSQVEFYANGALIAADTEAPFGAEWTPRRAGAHTLLAVGRDNFASMATSAPVNVTVTAGGPTTNNLIPPGSEWRYLDDGSDQGAAWSASSFNDGSWKTGRAQFGYGDGDETTVVSFGPNSGSKYPTTYFRKRFVVENASAVEAIEVGLLRDDGAIVYLNGTEVFRVSMPAGPVNYRTYATTAGEYSWDMFYAPAALLRDGENVIAVEVHQGNASSSDLSFDLQLFVTSFGGENVKPVVQWQIPQNQSIYSGGAAITLSADAFDLDGAVREVRFLANGALLGTDGTEPYSIVWSNVSAGEHTLTATAIDNANAQSSASIQISVSSNNAPPRIATVVPAAGPATNLSEITVTFSKPVRGVDAGDLLVNGAAALAVNGGNATYTFKIAPPGGTNATVSWAANHGVTDLFTPPSAFDGAGAGASWSYRLVDTIAPKLASMLPAPGATVRRLNRIVIEFSEVVTGVTAWDLLLGSTPASSVAGSGAGPYEFTYATAPTGLVQARWAEGHEIADTQGNPFAGGAVAYTVNPSFTPILISEIMYHPISERDADEWVELQNLSAEAVSLAGWSLSDGVDFVFPNVTIPAGGRVVVAADPAAFRAAYPSAGAPLGPWSGHLSNTGEAIELTDAAGTVVDLVKYADEGDWAVRQRGRSDRGYRGWRWHAEHDGEGKSLEVINSGFDNSNGQNWASSRTIGGTPGQANSAGTNNIAPLIGQAAHFPAVPTSADSVLVTARVRDEADLVLPVTLYWRVDALPTNAWTSAAMNDTGVNGDVSAGDGVYSAVIPPQPNNTIVEFYLGASDSAGNARTWPSPAIPAADGMGPSGQVANLVYQVDNAPYTDTAPLLKLVMTAAERAELQAIYNNAPNSDAQVNATFIGLDPSGGDIRYLVGVRNRGHGSRTANPRNARVNFRSDDRWQGVTALNLNSQYSWLQSLGAALNLKSQVPGAYSRLVRLRMNNVDVSATGSLDRTYGFFAANEAINSDWADNHFPDDSDGNIYRAIRDLTPVEFDYRVTNIYRLYGPEDYRSYTNTWFKESNVSQNDWTDLIGMLRVFGINGTEPYTMENVRRVINIEEWVRHLAVMNLLGNSETGLNSGYNDDYFMYRGVKDPRFVLMYYDLDQILGYGGSFAATGSIFSARNSNGSGAAFSRFLDHPEILPLYYRTLRELLQTSFSEAEFNATVDQALTGYVPDAVKANLKNWMSSRRQFVLSQIPTDLPDAPPTAVVIGALRARTPLSGALLQVTGEGVTHFKYSLNGAPFSAEMSAANAISLSNLSSTNTLRVIARTATSAWQPESRATTVTWVVDPAWPGVRINEVLAKPAPGEPDQIELYNESGVTVSLQGMALSDDPARPFRGPLNVTSIGPREYVVVTSTHLGFGLDDKGEDLRLYLSTANGPVLLDSVRFGRQISNYSIGRLGQAGEWRLTQPTLGRANSIQPLGDASAVRINEWLALGLSPYPDDFIELHNPELLPVNVGGHYLTDRPLGRPTASQIWPLTFLEPKGFAAFFSGNGNQGDEIEFGLSSEFGEIALITPAGAWLDHIFYSAQQRGVSMGLCPDGGVAVRPLQSPTPGGPNLCRVEPPAPQTVPLLTYTNVWKYNAAGMDLGTAWRETAYNDAGWLSGPGLLGFENDPLPEPIRTSLADSRGIITAYFRTTFSLPENVNASQLMLTHVIDDGAIFYLNGQLLTTYNMSPGAAYNTLASGSVGNASFSTVVLPADLLRAGLNHLAVEVHQSAANSTDLVFGIRLAALVFNNEPSTAGIVINEALAHNVSFADGSGRTPDWIELHNPSNLSIDLRGMTLARSLDNRGEFVFPQGSVIPAKGYYLLNCDSSRPPSNGNAPFDLPANGGTIYLFASATNGAPLLSSLTYGLQAADYSLGRLPDGGTNLLLCIPTPGLANRAANLGSPANLRVNEWLSNPSRGEDWIEIVNLGPEPVDISLFGVSDNVLSPLKHRLPRHSYIGSGSHGFLQLIADQNLALGADHVDFRLSASGEAALISDASGAVIDSVRFGPQSPGVSHGRLPDGSTNIVLFSISQSPARSNFLPLEDVVISEVLTHTDLPLEDAIELRNLSAVPVNISGWFLSDSAVNLRKFSIPANTILPPNGYLVFTEAQFNSDAAGEKFALSSSSGEEVFLSQALAGELTGYRAYASFGAAFNGVSFGRVETTQGVDYAPQASRTLGGANSAVRIGPVVISEIMYHPPGTNDALEFVELLNISNSAVPLFDTQRPTNKWRVRGGVQFTFPQHTLPAGAALVLVNFDPGRDAAALAAFRSAYGEGATLLGPFTGRLNNAGDIIELQAPDAPQLTPGADFGLVPYVTVDKVAYADLAPWPTQADGFGSSLQKRNGGSYGNEPQNWLAAAPTPGQPLPGGADGDSDGIPDAWELANGLDPANPADAAQDADNDGASNLHEYLTGTDPRDAASALRVNIAAEAGGRIILTFTAKANRAYTVQSAPSLGGGNWATVREVSAASLDQNIVIEAQPTARMTFWRLLAR